MALNEEVKNSWDKLGHRRREDLRATGHQMIPVLMSIAWMCTFPAGICSYVSKLRPGIALGIFGQIKVEKLCDGPHLPLLN